MEVWEVMQEHSDFTVMAVAHLTEDNRTADLEDITGRVTDSASEAHTEGTLALAAMQPGVPIGEAGD